MGTLFWMAVAAFAAWNIPQPAYAKKFQDMVVSKWKEFRSKS